ncbi:MAG: hypothetical protein K2X11_09230, partial [Acetobacteraceae bacterium]|nr:hypothetical protein [Acetobacteraceae bacterium]
AAVGPAAQPCEAEPPAGSEVLVASRRGVVRGRLNDLAREADPSLGSYLRLAAPLVEGDSGGGVFEPTSLCLVGIVSQRDPDDPGSAWIVRTPVLRRFLSLAGP